MPNSGRSKCMSDFTVTSTNKTALRKLTEKIADLATLDNLVQDVLTKNPWGCTPYSTGTSSNPAIEKTKTQYGGSVSYENTEAKTVGSIPVHAPTRSALENVLSTISGTASISSAIGGTASHDPSGDTGTVTLKCHFTNDELVNVVFTRESVRISGYEDDSIRTTIENWADGVPALA